MGYGYVGAYLAYGFPVKSNDITETFLKVWPYELSQFYQIGPKDARGDLWDLGITEEERTSLLIDPVIDTQRTIRAKKRHCSRFQPELQPCFHEVDASLFVHPNFPRILVKEFGDDDDNIQLFVCWRTCFRGGEFCPNKPEDSTDAVINLPVASAKTMLDLEQSFDLQEMKQFCSTMGIPLHKPAWQTLITFGQWIY